jgi:hypothetical protein
MVLDLERVKDEVCGQTIGKIEYVKCLTLLTLMHHLMVYFLEAWSLQNGVILLLQTLISSVITILIILIYDIFK